MTVQEASLLSGRHTVRSIRDTGYKSTDYAIAELIDNAVDAGAENVTIAIVESPRSSGQRLTYRVNEIYVVDDGSGMAPNLANMALSFGGSGSYDNREKIGRFGMGLPQASVSQAKLTEVWSWQKSQIQNAHYTFLDLNKIESDDSPHLTVPWPRMPQESEYKALPKWVGAMFDEHHQSQLVAGQKISSGSVVRWTQLDRLRWVRAASVLEHTEYLLGRIYRKYIAEGKLNIRLLRRVEGEGSPEVTVRKVRVNDPLYLIQPADTTLEFWEKQVDNGESLSKVTDTPPFVAKTKERVFELRNDAQGTSANVIVRFSQALPEARPGKKAGSTTHQGKHAKNNRGISVVRASRELTLEKTLVNEATDRWWGVEVEFPADLDEIFGVTNNKQEVPYFSQALRYVVENDVSAAEAKEEGLFADEDPVAQLYDVAATIKNIVNSIKSEVKAEKKSLERLKAPSKSNLVQGVSMADEYFGKSQTTPGETKKSEHQISNEEVMERLQILLREQGKSDEYCEALANQYKEGLKVQFIDESQSQSPAFFWPDEHYDLKQIFINNTHPAYLKLIEPLRVSSEDVEGMGESEVKQLLNTASDALGLLIYAFSRLELEGSQDSAYAAKYRDVRENWGRKLREIFEEPELSELFEGLDDDDD